MIISESDKLLLKSEGVRDCVKWVKKKAKETKKELDSCNDFEQRGYIQERLNEQIDIKISLEKYMRKLKHEAREFVECEEINASTLVKNKLKGEVRDMGNYPEHLHEVINEDLQENIYDETLEDMTIDEFITELTEDKVEEHDIQEGFETEELGKIEEVKAYLYNGEVYKTLKEAQAAEGYNMLEFLVGRIYYRGITEDGLVDEIILHKEELLSVLNKLK